MTGYSVKLDHDFERHKDRWRYTFHLKREPGQESMEKVLAFPNSDQLDDWEDYKAGLTHTPEEEMIEEMYEGLLDCNRSLIAGGEGVDRLGSIDSGYFSPHLTALMDDVSSP